MAECAEQVREFLLLLNAGSGSCLPLTALEILKAWSLEHNAQSPILKALIQVTGITVKKPEMLAQLTENVLDAYFTDNEEEAGRLAPGN